MFFIQITLIYPYDVVCVDIFSDISINTSQRNNLFQNGWEIEYMKSYLGTCVQYKLPKVFKKMYAIINTLVYSIIILNLCYDIMKCLTY